MPAELIPPGWDHAIPVTVEAAWVVPTAKERLVGFDKALILQTMLADAYNSAEIGKAITYA